METPTESAPSAQPNTDSTTTEGPSSSASFDEETLNRARQISLDGTGEDAEFAAPPERPPDAPGQDPAVQERGPVTLEERQEEWRDFLSPVMKAADTTAEIFVPKYPGITPAQQEQLAEVWGNVLGHYYEIRRGSEAGDWARATGTTSAIASDVLQQMREQGSPEQAPNGSDE